MKRVCLISILWLLPALVCQAKIKPFEPRKTLAKSSKKAWIESAVPVQFPAKVEDNTLHARDVEKMIPTDMRATDDAGEVAQQIGDRGIQNWLNSPAVKNSSVGQTAGAVENAMKAEVSLGGAKPNEVNHKFTFQYLALQAIAKLEYKGWLNAAMNHDDRARSTSVQISERLWDDKDLTLSHTASTQEGLSALGVRWSW